MSWVLTHSLTTLLKNEGNHHNSTKTGGCKHRPDLWRLKTRMTVTETLDQLSITQGQVNTAALERKRPKKGMVLEVVTTLVLIPSDCFSLVLLFVRFVAADGV